MINLRSLFSLMRAFEKRYQLKKTIGDLLLIVVAVTLAFGLENWKNARHDRETEQFLLRQMRSALTDDLKNLNTLQAAFNSTYEQSRVLQEYLRNKLPYADSLDAYFGSVLGFWTFQYNHSAYEVLKSNGLQLISNDTLLLKIVQVYDQSYPNFISLQLDDRSGILDIARPYYLKYFKNVRFKETATPLYYKDLIADDSYFQSILNNRIRSLEFNCIAPIEQIRQEVFALVSDLNQEIDARSR